VIANEPRAPGSPVLDEVRARAEARVKGHEEFRIHLVIFVLVNALFWFIWLTSGANLSNLWPLYALLGWGIGLVAHWYVTYGRDEAAREAEVQREIARLRRGGGTA
jgi:hypothetical protein